MQKFSICCTATAKSVQSCPTLCDPMDSSPPGSPVPGILQARTLEWVAISFSNAWKLKGKVKSLSRIRLLATPWTAAYQAPHPCGFPGKSTGVGCHCLLRICCTSSQNLKKKKKKKRLQKENRFFHNNSRVPSGDALDGAFRSLSTLDSGKCLRNGLSFVVQWPPPPPPPRDV